MRITADLLRRHGACVEQVTQVEARWPSGAEPTVEALTEAARAGLDPWWLCRLLPAEGPGSQRAYALWCAQQVAHLADAPRVGATLEVVRRRVADPASASDAELAEASSATQATAAAWAASAAEAWAAAACAAVFGAVFGAASAAAAASGAASWAASAAASGAASAAWSASWAEAATEAAAAAGAAAGAAAAGAAHAVRAA